MSPEASPDGAPPRPVQRLRGLLVGYGSIGRRHLANLHDLGVTDWAVVRTGSGMLPFEPPCPVRSYDDLATALDVERPTFAVVANPASLHVGTALACVTAGCDVLIEKPVSHSTDGLDELEAAAMARGAAVLVGFQFRFDPGLQRVGRLLRDQVAGDPVQIRSHWGEHLPGWHPWEDWRAGYAARRELGGGVHHTLSHPLDYLAMLFGRPEVEAAFLVEGGPLALDVAEAADIRLRFGSGVTAQVHLDFWGRPSRHELEIACSRGTITWDHLAGQVRVWSEDDPRWRVEQVPGVEARDALFVAEARHLLDIVARRADPRCTLADGIEAVRLCAAVDAASARSGLSLMETT